MDWKSLTKLLRPHRRHASTSATTTDPKLKSLKSLFSQSLPFSTTYFNQEPSFQEIETLIADLFTSISIIKSSYAQLQIAHSPYDPESIQRADLCIVTELKKISQLKQLYIKNQLSAAAPAEVLNAKILEQKNLIKTFQITVNKLESEIESKNLEVSLLKSRLCKTESMFCLHNLHISGLNSKHFSIVLKLVYKSVKSLVRIMMKEMDFSGWDLDSASHSIHRVKLKPENRKFAFESYVCSKMFSGFHAKDFNHGLLKNRLKWKPGQFFKEFQESKLLEWDDMFDKNCEFREFCKVKHTSVVHPKLGKVITGSGFVSGFNEVAKRVWLLHCLMYSFKPELNGSIFQVRNGSRFSEVFMESVADVDQIMESWVVGFMVVPGFRVGSNVIQSKVYLCDR